MALTYQDYLKTEAWRSRAEAAKQRVEQRCQICNRPASRVPLTVHHRTYERLGNERPEDLTVLCRGCHELYEKNRRIPSPSPDQPLPQASVATKAEPTQPGKQPVAETRVAPRRPFAPARPTTQQPAFNADETAATFLLRPEPDNSYTLATAEATSPAAVHYHLTPAEESQPTARGKTDKTVYRPKRRQQIGIALMTTITLLLVAGLYDLVTLPGALIQPRTTNSQPAAATSAVTPTSSALTTVAAIANALPTPTVSQDLAPTLTPPLLPTSIPPVSPTVLPTVPPTVLPTVLPTVTPLPPTPTSAPPTVAPTVAPIPQSHVLRTGLVCAKPCSCAPVVRTITQGTPVTVLTTQLCGTDTWSQIGAAEWVGPGLIDSQ